MNYSQEHLQRVFNRLSVTLSRNGELTSVYIDRVNNRVGVTLNPNLSLTLKNGVIDRSSLPDEIEQLLADPAIIVMEGEVQRSITAVKGGQGWKEGTTGPTKCTLGFKVISSYS